MGIDILSYISGKKGYGYCAKFDIKSYLLGKKAAVPKEPITFHMRDEEGRLIILGAYKAVSKDGGLYIDCEPAEEEQEWEYPVLNGNVLTITQVYSATLNGNVLEVE